MKNNDVAFFVQYRSTGSSSRGIQSGGVVLTFDDMFDQAYVTKLLRNGYAESKLMYQVGRNSLQDVKSMRVDEFESIFRGHTDDIKYLLGYSDLTSPFRKEILTAYGPDLYREVKKSTTVYKKGDIFMGSDNIKYIYLGNFEYVNVYIDKELVAAYKGHFYMPMSAELLKNTNREFEVDTILEYFKRVRLSPKKFSANFLKTKKKAEVNSVMNIGHKGLNSEGEFNVILNRDFIHNYERKLKIVYKEA